MSELVICDANKTAHYPEECWNCRGWSPLLFGLEAIFRKYRVGIRKLAKILHQSAQERKGEQ